jgi:transcriptional regulator with XRE-family HTH domain
MLQRTPTVTDGRRTILVPVSEGDAIRLSLLSRGHTLTSIAHDLHVSRPRISQAIHGHAPANRILAHVAALLGVPVESIRPQRRLTPVSVSQQNPPVNVRVSALDGQVGTTVRRRSAAA